MVDARLPDGSRVNVVVPPAAPRGPKITLRKFARRRLRFFYTVPAEAMSASMVDRNRIRWPDAAAVPADLPETSPTWNTYK